MGIFARKLLYLIGIFKRRFLTSRVIYYLWNLHCY